MRASRLLSILMTLQAKGGATAQDLAEACEVSVRTIYRDIDALSAAGVPVYSERGASGGYRLLDGYRTRLNGLSREEAEAVFLGGLAGPAAALGLESIMATAQLKLAAALPADMRRAAERIRSRFHLDAHGWFHEAEEPACLRDLARAVWDQRLIEIRYRSWRSERHRRLKPLGLVLKSGAWYLVGAVGASIRTYRIARIRELRVLEESFDRPDDRFDLAGHWSDNSSRLEEELHQKRAVVRLSPTGFSMAEHLLSPFARSRMAVEEPDDQGNRIVTIPVGTDWHATSELLRFGRDAEVLGPPELRQRMAETIAGLHCRYERAKLIQ